MISRPFTTTKSPSNASAPLLFRNKRHLWDAVPNAHASVSLDGHEMAGEGEGGEAGGGEAGGGGSATSAVGEGRGGDGRVVVKALELKKGDGGIEMGAVV